MELIKKLVVLADAAKYDASCASSGAGKRNSLRSGGIGSTEGAPAAHESCAAGIQAVLTPAGMTASLIASSMPLQHVVARLFRTGSSDGGPDLLDLFRWRQHGRQTQRSRSQNSADRSMSIG